ncbi:MAG: heparinase II/III domain-containing protein [Thermoguttaceae bacterium]
MIRIRTFLLVLTLLAAAARAAIAADGPPKFDYPPTISLEEVRQWVDKVPAGHPRLLANRTELAGLAGSVEGDPLRKAVADAIVKQAVLLREVPPIERQLEGRRLLGESRRCVRRALILSMAYHLTGDGEHARRCEEEMLAVAKFSDWNPSHFLDTAEMTFAMAVGYDWLYDQLPESSRAEIRRAIVEKGVSLPWETSHKGWVTARNNWGQVCHAGITAGALAVMEDEKDLAVRTVHNALHNVTRSMHAYEPNGSYPEGPGYWGYGTSYNVVLIALLESVLGSDFGLTKAPGFDVTGQYPALMCGPSGEFFNYADGGAGRGPESCLYWFAGRFGRPDWLLGEREELIGAVSKVDIHDARGGGDRLLPLALLWMEGGEENPAIRMPLHWQSGSQTAVTVHRSSWTDPDATFVGLKGGSPSDPHGQMDIGSFVLDAEGVRWAMDLGAEGYHGIESRGMNLWSSSQDSDRWTIFRQSNEGHNTLVIDGQLQKAAGRGPVVTFSDDAAFPHSIVDMSKVYEGQAGSVRRGIALVEGRNVLVQDEITGLKPGSRVRWGMITPGTPAEAGKARMDLKQGKARLGLTIVAPQSAGWKVVDTAKPRHEWDSRNPGTCMVQFEVVAPESGKVTLAVLAEPGGARTAPADKLVPLEQWGQR